MGGSTGPGRAIWTGVRSEPPLLMPLALWTYRPVAPEPWGHRRARPPRQPVLPLLDIEQTPTGRVTLGSEEADRETSVAPGTDRHHTR